MPYVAVPAPYWSVAATVARTWLLSGSRSSVTLAVRPAGLVGDDFRDRHPGAVPAPLDDDLPADDGRALGGHGDRHRRDLTCVHGRRDDRDHSRLRRGGPGRPGQQAESSRERDTEDEETTSHGH